MPVVVGQGNTQEGLSFLSEATAAASSEHVSPGFRTTAEFATTVWGGSFKTELELLEFLLPDEEASKEHIVFLMSWAPNADITQATQLMLPNAKLNQMTWQQFRDGITLLNRADAMSPNNLVESAIQLISDVSDLAETKLEANDQMSNALGQMIITRLGLKPGNEVMAFDSDVWLEAGGLGNICYHKLGKIVAQFWKTVPKNLK